MLGLGEFGNNYYTYSNIRYAIYLAANVLYTSEYGALTNVGTYATGDTMRVAIEGTAVKYYKNGALLRTSAIALTYPLYANVAFYQNGATLTGAVVHGGNGGSTAQIKWLVADHLGTPRMIFDQTGSLANVKRHDYLPFGEELYAGVGGRTAAQGYVPDTTRQRFTGYEADTETGLHYARARFQSSIQGRFTSPDPLLASGRILLPQSWNRYSYVLNQPLGRTDPLGLQSKGQGAKDKDIKETQDEPPDEDLDTAVINIHAWADTGKPLSKAELAAQLASRNANAAQAAAQTNTGGTNPASSDGVQDINNVFTAIGNSASLSRYRYLSEDTLTWRGQNGKWYSIFWGGNQHTGARSIYANQGAALRSIGRSMFILSAAVSTYQLATAVQEGNTAAGVKAGLDIAMGLVGTFGGPVGAGVATAYFAIDFLIGWENIGRAAVNLVSSRNESGP
jgi:RHS repeat-associated protein